ncbi:MAG TPA: glycosyltransferase family 39 protein [Rhodanobacteraceae bacterium]|nr:glycosyltransferase family 39 protein [Rhodanobacteraceae bacterium]
MKVFRAWLVPVSQRPWVRLLALGLLLGFAFQGSRGLWSPDEGRYTDGALQMIDSGNYLVPAYSPDRINLSKPPVTYWAIAGAVKVFGRNTWAVRTPYAVAFVLTVMLLYAIGRILLPEKPWLPGLVYGCATFPFLTANIISTDVLLALFEAVAALGFVRLAFTHRRRAQRLDAALMWLGLGLAFLTKGPPGLILLLAVIPFVIIRNGWRGLGRIFQPLGIAVFLVSGLIWYAIVVLHDPGALHYFLYQEIYQRLFTGAQQRHPGPFGWAVVYLPILVIGSLPWWPALSRNLHRPGSLRNLQSWLRQHPVESFLLLWLLIPLLVFCLAQSRLPLYVLPLFLPISLLLAFGLRDGIDLGKPKQRVLLGVWILALLAAKGSVAYFVHSANDNRLAAQQLAAMVRPGDYGAVVFVENTDQPYAVEENTPWGLSLYLGKPIYGVAWTAPESVERLCQATHGQRASLLVMDAATAASALQAVANRCHLRSIVHVGSWRHHELDLIKA